jgi:hypothetical protein
MGPLRGPLFFCATKQMYLNRYKGTFTTPAEEQEEMPPYPP